MRQLTDVTRGSRAGTDPEPDPPRRRGIGGGRARPGTSRAVPPGGRGGVHRRRRPPRGMVLDVCRGVLGTAPTPRTPSRPPSRSWPKRPGQLARRGPWPPGCTGSPTARRSRPGRGVDHVPPGRRRGRGRPGVPRQRVRRQPVPLPARRRWSGDPAVTRRRTSRPGRGWMPPSRSTPERPAGPAGDGVRRTVEGVAGFAPSGGGGRHLSFPSNSVPRS